VTTREERQSLIDEATRLASSLEAVAARVDDEDVLIVLNRLEALIQTAEGADLEDVEVDADLSAAIDEAAELLRRRGPR
jgi:hypothetical protein